MRKLLTASTASAMLAPSRRPVAGRDLPGAVALREELRRNAAALRLVKARRGAQHMPVGIRRGAGAARAR